MADLYEFLMDKLQNVKKLAVMGVGSIFMADDGAGIMVVERLKKVFIEDEYPRLRFYIGETAPENFSGEIKRFNPCHLLVIDAADAHEKPGSIMCIEPEIIGGISFSTHLLPLRIMTEYLQRETGMGVTFLGIQHKDVTYGAAVTQEINEAVDEISGIIEKVLRVLCHGMTG